MSLDHLREIELIELSKAQRGINPNVTYIKVKYTDNNQEVEYNSPSEIENRRGFIVLIVRRG